METNQSDFELELKKLIKHRTKYESVDFKLSHSFVWLSILTSFLSSILVAANVEILKTCKIPLAILAGLPGLCVIIEKTFDFANRSFWGTMYKIDLQELQDAIEFGKIDKYEASKKMREIIQKNESDFIKIGSFFKREKTVRQQTTNTNNTSDNTSQK